MQTEESAFQFPRRPQEAVVRLLINVESGEGDTLRLFASLVPGGMTWDHERVEGIFRDARVVPLEGTYVMEAGPSGTIVVSAPEGVDKVQRRALVFTLGSEIGRYRQILVEALQVFPSPETLTQAAREVVSAINIGSIERKLLSEESVIDARTVLVEGVKCVHCGFGPQGMLASLLEIFDRSRSNGIRIQINERDGQPVVLIGFLGHGNPYAAFLNQELAKRLKAAIQDLAVEVMTQVLVTIESQRRMGERVKASVLATYGIDPMAIAAQVDALEAQARAEMAEETEAEDPDYDGDDGTDDEDPPGDVLEEPIGEPVPTTSVSVTV